MVVNVWWGGPLCLVLANVVAVYCILYTVRKPISFLRGHHPPCDDGEREDDGGRKDDYGDDGDYGDHRDDGQDDGGHQDDYGNDGDHDGQDDGGHQDDGEDAGDHENDGSISNSWEEI